MKLTKAQEYALIQAAIEKRRSLNGGWFVPSHYVLTEVYTTKATCKALCSKGLMEYRVALEAINGYPEVLEFRITEAGLKQSK